AVKPEPGQAHGTGVWVVLPQPAQAMRGTSQCSQASNSGAPWTCGQADPRPAHMPTGLHDQ
ncbi:hypothetical protein, partial [Piscinibacter sakaiensis]|uniref:hypothetical protein n=1 Tax=Piscinibacter sakaiensis TaxID=1547922 RepID=UPI001E64B7B4